MIGASGAPFAPRVCAQRNEYEESVAVVGFNAAAIEWRSYVAS